MTPTRRILLFYDNTDLDRQILRPVDYSAFEDEWNRQGEEIPVTNCLRQQ